MNFVIITHVKHIKQKDEYLAYAPYVREMNIWLKHVSEVTIVAPLINAEISKIDIPYLHENINFKTIPEIVFTSFYGIITSVFKLPIIFQIF